MLTRKLSSTKRPVLLATLAALVLNLAEPPFAAAGQPAATAKGVSASASSDATDFSAAKRRRRYNNGSRAAGLAFMGIVGTIAGIAAEQQRRDDYNNYYNNGYGYAPGYYGGGPYYGRRYYYGY